MLKSLPASHATAAFPICQDLCSKCRNGYFTDLTGNSLLDDENQRMKLKLRSGDALLTFPSVEDML